MAIKINFDTSHNPEKPTIILAKKNGDKIGQLNAKAIEISDVLKDASEITFNIHKFVDNKKCELWEQIVDFKLIHCVEWDMWFEITVELDETTETIKTVSATCLGQAELSQIMLHGVEINTENDIAREEYEIPTILYNPAHPEASLLHRMMEKAPHYSIAHVDDSIVNIQRTFTFDDSSIYDSFQKVSEEINCLFVFPSNSDENGNIQRTISVYDLESNCKECGFRGEFTGVCPECGSQNINEGYGDDTAIFITSDELADDIHLSADTDSIKNCFKLEAGDDLMTATIRNCNPNGTDYIWYISDATKSDMSQELVDRINSYDELFNYYQKNYVASLDNTLLEKYNTLVRKYKVYNDDLEEIEIPITGYPKLMNTYYNTIDLEVYLKSALMPTVEMSDTNAELEASKLTVDNLSPVSVNSIANLSEPTADNAVLAMAKIVVDSRYKVKVSTSTLERGESYQVWTGNFTVTNYSDEDDTAISEIITITIDDDYSSFVQQKLQKALKKDDTEDLSVSGLFAKSNDDFVNELKKYSLNCLTSFLNSCQSCIDILIEQGTGDEMTWAGQEPNLYEELYAPYLNKLSAIESEIKVRQEEIDLITGIYDSNNELKTYGIQNYIEEIKADIQKNLDFEDYLGFDLWLEFCSFRREDKYSNSNYVSDGLNNAELFSNAYEFVQVAQKDIYKSAELQHSISTSLKNLLVIKKFEPLVKHFKVGNWFRIEIDDVIYKLRLIKYSINYDSLNTITVDFSDVVKIKSTVKSVQEVISQAALMATSYSNVQRQAKQGEKSNSVLNDWTSNGLDATNTKIIGGADNQAQTWDEHGMLFREYDSISDSYDSTQLKIINSTISITDDNWNSVKTAIGKYYYFHPETNQLTMAYGVNAETIVGNLILGEKLGLYNDNGSLKFDDNGLVVTNGINTVIIDPNNESVFNIKDKDLNNLISFNDDGDLVIVGNITAKNLTLLDGASVSSGNITGLSDVAISGEYDDLKNAPELAKVATTGSYKDLLDAPEEIDIDSKFDIPTNDDTAIVGQYLSKQSEGSLWKNAETEITENGLLPVSGKAVYEYALSKKQDVNNAEKLLYIDTDGNITSISIDDLKALLGIEESGV